MQTNNLVDPETTREFISVQEMIYHSPTEWLVPDEVPVGLTLLIGPKSIGKSALAVDYALRVARRASVLYVVAEDDGRFPERCKAWTLVNGQQTGRLFFDFETLPLDRNELDGFKSEVAPLRPRLIVVDPLQACIPIGVSMETAMEFFTWLAQQTQASLLLVTETGSTSMGAIREKVLARCDTVLELAAEFDEEHVVLLHCRKTLPAITIPSRYLLVSNLELDGTRRGSVIQRSLIPIEPDQSVKLQQRQIQILRAIDGKEEARMRDVVADTGISLASTYRIIDTLKELDLVRTVSTSTVAITPRGRVQVSNVQQEEERESE